MKYFLSVMITFAVLLGTANIKTKNKKVGQNFFQKRLERLGKGFMTIPLPNGKEINLGLSKNAIAEESACDTVLTAVQEGVPSYTAGALGYFNMVLYSLNNVNSANIENVFCHFAKTMEMDGEINDSDPAIIEFEEEGGGSMFIRVTISAPSEDWASEYTKKAVVELGTAVDTFETTYMTMWWGYATDSTDTTTTKGYLIEGSPKTLGGARANYMQWDLTGVNQVGRFLSAEFGSAEEEVDPTRITPTNYWLSGDGVTSDATMYGRFKLNTETNEVYIQGMIIEGERKQGETPTEYGCFRIFGTGKKGDMMVISKTRDSHSSDGSTGFAQRGNFTVDETGTIAQDKTIQNMDAACMPDLTTTPNLVGNMNDPGLTVSQWEDNLVTALATAADNSAFAKTDDVFDFSCKELNELNAAGKAFDTTNGVTWVDFSNTPEDVFGTTLDVSDDSDISAPTRAELCSDVNTSNNIDNVTKCYCPSES